METPKHGQNIITRGLPKTGQATQYRAGDDGQYEAGWWVGRLNANNRERWITKTIGGDDIVVDRATGLMWPTDFTAAGGNLGNILNWNPAIDWALALDFAGFTDWRLPNIIELFSIVYQEVMAMPLIWMPPFENCQTDCPYWSSTTEALNNINAFVIYFSNGKIEIGVPKGIASQHVVAVRKGL